MPSSRRNRIILIVIIIVCISMVTFYVRESDTGPLHKMQNFFLDLFSPISNFFSKIFRPVKDGIVNLFHLPSLAKEKRELQKEVASLRRQAGESKELEAEVEEFKRLLHWSEENAQLDTVGADIVGQSPSNWQRLMIVNKGSSSGVKKYMSVVTEEGLAGRIISVGSRSSVVQLITDSRSGMGARDLRNRETGIVEGRNEDTMRFVPMNEEAVMQVGDVMVTSGLGGTSPPGIAIGKVTQVKKRSVGLARLVEVKPFVRFSRLDKVLIIITPEPESVILKEAQ
ncbi:MAG: rod shape-determining protein MreC [Actinobacteria bacterium]|nr:rod shape-determining protein MreC [Actinomycetota bacterium]